MNAIFINQAAIRRNRQQGGTDPVIAVTRGDRSELCSEVEITDRDGRVVATVRYSPDEPLVIGGPSVWIEAEHEARITSRACRRAA